MPLISGTRVGPYEIVSALGAGGMGEVYRARDTKLGRDVALKILPDAFANDPERLARFEREAKTLASLNHPHIAQIHGFEQSRPSTGSGQAAISALVMELVEGEDLSQHIARGRLPVDEALRVALQIADALEAAHERGIVHRDLKPANVKITPDEKVKVLDFGLAKLGAPGGAGARPPSGGINLTHSPTLSIMATQAGVILGTAPYMSPEQARGKDADTRADIWAFGCVLYEMLTGHRAFAGEEVSDILAGILKSDPSWEALPRDLPAPIHRLLRRCLQKDRRQRLQHIGDARIEIEEAKTTGPAETTGVRPARGLTRERFAWTSALVLFAIAAAGATRWAAREAPVAPELRVDIVTPPTTDPSSFAISPDGRKIVFAATAHGASQLWVRPLDSAALIPLSGTEGGYQPFWSPDNRSVGFFAANKLKRIDLDGGGSQSLANVITPAGGTWSADGTILYTPNNSRGIFRVAATGGEATALASRDVRPIVRRFPHVLPDGRHFLFFVASAVDTPGVYVGEIGKNDTRFLLNADGAATFASGHLWFVRQRTLFVQPFDTETLEVSGPAIKVADDVSLSASSAVAVSASAAGPVAYRTGATIGRLRLVWFDRSGKQLESAGDDGTSQSNPSLSPDGRRVALQASMTGQNPDVWLLDIERNVSTRFTFDPAIDALPVWSPDGTRLVFNSTRTGTAGLYVKRTDGTPEESLLLNRATRVGVMAACDWSPDGRFVLYRSIDAGSGTYDLFVLPLDGDRKPLPVAQTPYDDRDGQFSPDGKWIAYQSDEAGRPDIYVQPFPGPGAKIRVSRDGGTQVRWRRDGRELFYVSGDNRLAAVPISARDGQLVPGAPLPLFTSRIVGLSGILRQQYVVSGDGQRFLMVVSDSDPTPTPITLLLNWRPRAQ